MQKGDLIRGKYRLVRLLGDGGMGSVFEANHEGLGTRVAIKVLHADLARRAGLVERFLREARVSAQIKSANVVQVMDVERTHDGVAYIVMELLEGEPLSSALERERKFSVGVACDYAVQILRALEAAHALGVVHRDLKPENVFVTFVSGKPLLKLIDFGIAKARQMDSQSKSLTVAGVVMGTPEYMAPEQAQSADKVDARSDLYAVGVMLYEMISGARPVTGEDARVVAVKIQRGEVRPLVHAAPGVPPDLAGIVHRAMAARPELRFSSATELRLAIEASASGRRPATTGSALGPADLVQVGGGALVSGTVLGASAEEAFRVALRTPVAIAGAPPPGTGHPQVARGPAWQGPGAAPGPPPAQGSGGGALRMASGYVPRSRRQGSSVWLLIALPVLLGAGIVVAFAFNGSNNGPSPQPSPSTASPPPTSTPVSVASITAPPEAPLPVSTATVAPLLPATPVPRPMPPASGPAPGPKPHPSGPSSATPSGAEPASPFPFPSEFPGLPNPFPLPSNSGGGPIFTIPTSLPTALPFPFPGAPAPAPSSAPTSVPSGKSI